VRKLMPHKDKSAMPPGWPQAIAPGQPLQVLDEGPTEAPVEKTARTKAEKLTRDSAKQLLQPITAGAAAASPTASGPLFGRPAGRNPLPVRTRMAIVAIVVAIPLLLAANAYFFDNRAYYATSMLIILLCMAPFAMIFEGRKPQARELVVIAVLVALAVAGRGAFYMIPQFKPVVAIVIIAGVTLGAESGFCVGALTGFISNFMFGQGPWTPWQMFAFGIIGFLAGIIFAKGLLPKRRVPLAIYGFLACMIVYGLIMDTATALMMTMDIEKTTVLGVYISGIPFNAIHGVATVIFIMVLANFMIAKLDRVREKYGLIVTEELEPLDLEVDKMRA